MLEYEILDAPGSAALAHPELLVCALRYHLAKKREALQQSPTPSTARSTVVSLRSPTPQTSQRSLKPTSAIQAPAGAGLDNTTSRAIAGAGARENSLTGPLRTNL